MKGCLVFHIELQNTWDEFIGKLIFQIDLQLAILFIFSIIKKVKYVYFNIF